MSLRHHLFMSVACTLTLVLISTSRTQAALTDVTAPGDLLVATSNNSPGAEGVANAIDNNVNTKYLNFDRLNTGFTVTPASGFSLVQGLTFTSANDAPERDPASFTLEGSNNGINFTPIASGAVPAFAARFETRSVAFTNNTPYLQYRLLFPTVLGPGGNSMQIAETEFLGTSLSLIDVTAPGDFIVPTSNNSPGAEQVPNAIDNNIATKYLNFDRLNTGFTVTPALGLTLVRGLTLQSANDAPERDPASFTLEGSNDGVLFSLIASGNVPAFTARFQTQTLTFDNSVPFLKYRLLFPTVVGPGGNSMQIGEVELLGNVAAAPVPEPATAALGAMGLGGLLLRRRRVA